MTRRTTMRSNKAQLVSALLAVAIVLVSSGAQAGRPQPGEEVPDFRLPAANVPGVKMVSLKDDILAAEGGPTVTVLSFFSMSCEPCKKELAYFQAIVPPLKGKLQVYVIDIDRKSEEHDAARTLFQEKGISLPLLLDRFQIVGRRFEVDKLPSCFFLGGDGKVIKASVGYSEGMRALVEGVIKDTLGVEPPKVDLPEDKPGEGSAAEAKKVEEDAAEEKPKPKRRRRKRRRPPPRRKKKK